MLFHVYLMTKYVPVHKHDQHINFTAYMLLPSGQKKAMHF